jgi:hypothetical protein
MTTFNPLQVPDQYNQYFTKYPQGYTILEALLNWVQQVNDMTDNLNSVNLRLDDFLAQFDGELQDTVRTIFDEMRADGTLQGMINAVLFGEVSFSAYPNIQAAVADSKTRNAILNLGNSTILATGNIPDFHNITFKPTAATIQRGTNIFYIRPNGTQVNNLYVNPTTGNDINDGLTPDMAFRTIQKAMDVLYNWANPTLAGQWFVNISNGSLAGGSMLVDIPSEYPITFTGADVGGHPTVPTTVITQGANFSGYGMRFVGKINVVLKNMKAVGYNGTTSSAGFMVAEGGELTTSNCHTSGNYWGISSQASTIEVPDGIHENNGFLPNATTGNGGAIRSLMLNRHHVGIQDAGSRTQTAIIRNNAAGVFVQESCTGHIDWCTIDGNTDGVLLNVNCRANLDGCLIQNNVRGVRRFLSHAYLSTDTTFIDNQANMVGTSGAQLTGSNLIGSTDMAYSTNESIVKTTNVNQTIQSTTNTPFFTVLLKAPFWKSIVNSVVPMKKLEFVFYGTITGAANTKAINLRFGGTAASISLGITEQGTFRYKGTIFFLDENNQYVFLDGNTHLNANKQSLKKLTLDMKVDQTITLEAQTANVLDSVQIDLVEFKVAGQ